MVMPIALSPEEPSNFTGFGDEPNWSIKFGIYRAANGNAADWDSGLRMARLVPATGNDLITQRRGRDPWEITLPIWLACQDDFDRLDAMQGERATLRFLAGITRRAGGSVQTIGNTTYYVYPGTMLTSLKGEAAPDGSYEATATFMRPYVTPAAFVPPVWPAPPSPVLPMPLLYVSPTLSRNRAGLVTPSIGGAVRPRTLDGAPAWGLSPNCTNLCTNPVFGTNATGWTAANGTIGRTTAWAYTGPASGLLTATGANAEASVSVTLAASTHVISAYVRNNATGSRAARIKYNGTLVGTAVVIPAGGEAIVTATVTGTGTSVGAGVVITTSVNGETFNIGHFQPEATVRTPFCPMFTAGGSLEIGDAWNGTPHASTSTRTGANISLAVTDWPWSAGAVYVRTAPESGRMYQVGAYGGMWWMLDAGATIRAELGTSGGPSSITRPVTVGAVTSIHEDWSGSAMGLTVNGSSITGTRGTPTAAATQTLNLVSDGFGNAAVQTLTHLYLFDRPLTDTERAVIDTIPTSQLGWMW